MKQRRAKIVCTLGPASIKPKVLSALVRKGMDVARLNFSHGNHAFHNKAIQLIRKLAQKYRRPIAILQDLQGIKLRVGMMKNGGVEIRKGTDLSIFPGEGLGDEQNIFVSYKHLLRDAKTGDRILLDDGLIQLRITKKASTFLTARVIEGGMLKDRKGVNLPGMKITMKSFTEKDKKDLAFGLKMNVDYVAVSFVREAQDIRRIRAWMKKKGKSTPIIAKIEKPEALDNIGAILDAADGIMIARGDLGVEVFPERVPLIQKDLINRANNKGKLVITATQMLESMKEHPRPTRAEATDVANAVIDGTDALMLSVETSAGAYPVESFAMMDRIITFTEQARTVDSRYERGNTYAEALASAACMAAKDVEAKVLVAFTQSGFTARLVSKFRPGLPIIAFTPDKAVLARLALSWGVVPKYMKQLRGTDQMLHEVEKALLSEKIAKKGDHIVIISGSPLSTQVKTNFMKIHQIGD
ncbi:MAG: pyruvate kinase [Nitrospirota bacterium]|nr:pyruvate kinase [Nitrospirota bacterium]